MKLIWMILFTMGSIAIHSYDIQEESLDDALSQKVSNQNTQERKVASDEEVDNSEEEVSRDPASTNLNSGNEVRPKEWRWVPE